MMDLSVLGIMGAGLLTFLSPCVLPLAPVYLGILAGGASPGSFNTDPLAGAPRFRMVLSTLIFVAGFTLVFAILGLSATFIGRALVAHRALFQQVGGLVIILLGMHFLGWLHLPSLQRSSSPMSKKTRFHYLNALIMGIAFAFVWTPCIGAVLGSVLTYTSLKTTSPIEGMGLLAAYGAGFGAPLVIFAAVADSIMPLFRRARRFVPVFSKVTGGLLMAVGLLMNTGYMSRLDAYLNAPRSASAKDEIILDLGGLMESSAAETCGGSAVGGTCGVMADNRPVMVEFFSPACHICRQMIPIVDTLKHDCVDDRVAVRMVDVTTDSGREMASKYGITGIPVFVFQDGRGTEKARLIGRQTYETLQQTLSALTGRQCEGYREIDSLRR